MQLSLSRRELASYVAKQLRYQFPDRTIAAAELSGPVRKALERTEFCFSHLHLKYYRDGGETRFNHLNTDQYAIFLYFLANSLHRVGGDPTLASKVYALNKALHGIDVFYEVELPDIFAFQHPVGTVLGRGRYSNYFFVYQRCSIGANLAGEYPTLGEGVVMFGGSAVIGRCTVADNCWFSVGAVAIDEDLPANSVVFGRSPNLVRKPTQRDVVRDMFLRQ